MRFGTGWRVAGRNGRPSEMSGTGRRTLEEVRNGLGRFGTGWRTLGEVQDMSGDAW